ncbi:MAG: site-specific DNA-methyltransferase [Anaerolinea sp.]|nr:site-specific DNA-methyltransferase [Anaerolinea sp.]
MQNTLYYGDNLKVLREHIQDESIDLIYLDPPFNSNRSYNVLFKDESGISSNAQITAFDDAWHWGDTAQQTYEELITKAPGDVSSLINSLYQFIGANQMMAYLVMMTARLVELHRVLKPTGTLYLHCDPTASHYLKILLDMIFGVENFINEIGWKRSDAHSDAKQGAKHFGRVHDVILFYSKTQNYFFNSQYLPLPDSTKDNWYRNIEPETGRRFNKGDITGPGGASKGNPFYEWKGISRYWRFSKQKMQQLEDAGKLVYSKSGMVYEKRYLDESKGVSMQDYWSDIDMLRGISSNSERLGYPTQKPLALLERIINSSSNPGDIVLDPFSGCGTCISAAQKLDRHWIGIDITHLAIAMHKSRLKNMFGLEPKKDYRVIGEPEDLPGAYQLSLDDRFQFEAWAISLVEARPMNRPTHSEPGIKDIHKGSDRGVDGIINFLDDRKGGVKKALVQVKSGKVNSGQIRDLKGVLEREQAQIGVFITLESPTRDMLTEALTSGSYHSEIWDKDYPKIQIVSIEELLNGAELKIPQTPTNATAFKKAEKVDKEGPKQETLDF